MSSRGRPRYGPSKLFGVDTAQRRNELQATYARFEGEIEQLNEQVLERADSGEGTGVELPYRVSSANSGSSNSASFHSTS